MDSTPHSSEPGPHHRKHHASPTDLLSSARVVAEAAKSAYSHQAVDKAKASEAAEDLLAAASQYGNLEGGSYGKYVEKAESYLHQYQSSDSTHSSTAAHPTTTTTTTTTTTAHHSSTHQSSEPPSSEGGFGDYLKLAQGFLK